MKIISAINSKIVIDLLWDKIEEFNNIPKVNEILFKYNINNYTFQSDIRDIKLLSNKELNQLYCDLTQIN